MVAVFVLGLAGTVMDRGSNLEVLLNSEIQTWGILAGMSIFAMAFQLSVVNAAKLGGSLAASFATILSVILTTGLHFLMGDFMWQSAVATLFILIPLKSRWDVSATSLCPNSPGISKQRACACWLDIVGCLILLWLSYSS